MGSTIGVIKGDTRNTRSLDYSLYIRRPLRSFLRHLHFVLKVQVLKEALHKGDSLNLKPEQVLLSMRMAGALPSFAHRCLQCWQLRLSLLDSGIWLRGLSMEALSA